MGIDFVQFERLVELSTRWRPEGRALMLGRQAFKIETPLRARYEQVLERHGLPGNRFDYLQEDGFAETFLRKIGFGEVEALDYSDYEGAGHVHDLNRSVPRSLHNKFDFIFDGGTLEHVFEVPTALRSVFRMLRPGGRFVSANGLNGWPGHGLYQFNPEMVWTFWARTAGCRMIDCRGMHKRPADVDYVEIYPDPALKGRRLRLGKTMPAGQVYLYYEVEKPVGAKLAQGTQQSDYEARWSEAGAD